jgi:hypothetical protein
MTLFFILLLIPLIGFNNLLFNSINGLIRSNKKYNPKDNTDRQYKIKLAPNKEPVNSIRINCIASKPNGLKNIPSIRNIVPTLSFFIITI